MSEIILASASPRRRELMKTMGLDFSVVVSDADESAADKQVPPGIYVQELAFLKAAASAKKIKKRKDKIIISADTIVVCDDKVLGKPKDKKEAFDMLKMLSGRMHKVFTGFCVIRLSDGKMVCKDVCTEVRFRELADEKIEKYIETGEPMDKAGAYGIQGLGSMFVSGINGDYFNVVGLPVSELAGVLEEEFDFDLM
ncbi:MAG: septum formation inhibitor Maf [Clostridia bacterium]|nr:septum formation inhibitor Maf [Clostridia bacterium]